VTEPRRVTVTSPRTEAARRRRAPARPLTELAEQTSVGDVLIRSLIRAQLRLALAVLVVFACVLGGLPLLFAIVPGAGRAEVFGMPLPWLLLGVVSFPLLVVLAVVYVRQAERNERAFVELVERP
jgi:putative solute:sodium symporter small subunit